MPRVHFVKKARKAIPSIGVAVGESYFWWKNRRKGAKAGIKRVSKTRPRPSRLTMSEFYQEVYSIQEDMEDAKPESMEDLAGMVEGWVERIGELRDSTQEKFDNMPEGLQQGDTGQLLEERVQALEDWQNELEAFDFSDDTVGDDSESKDEDAEQALADKLEEVRGCTCSV